MEIGGKVVVVTGASSGIGAATARAAASSEAQLVLAARLAARNRERLDALAAELGGATTAATDAGPQHRRASRAGLPASMGRRACSSR
jgi:NADP-dependent 3-hydroxy acid dehydrogenase YdfG